MTARWMWTAGLAVAIAAAAATAHGAYGVARAAQVPPEVALLYPAITDGLAVVAYATTTRLQRNGRHYAWAVVVLAAGLSGIAQATWLAGGVDSVPGPVRFGVGAWPAMAAAVVAHLLYLLAATPPDTSTEQPAGPVRPPTPVQPVVQPHDLSNTLAPNEQPSNNVSRGPGDRARATARAHLDRHRSLPTVSELVDAAGVGRGTAAAALKELRADLDEGGMP
ncbi:MAG: hypothetical protein ACT4QF_01575 [Sporichthyaceae bacterium]